MLVLCQGGGTSGLLANALAKAARERGINLETAAEAYGNHVDMLPDFDLVVLAPQAASYLADLQKDCDAWATSASPAVASSTSSSPRTATSLSPS